MPKVSIIVPNYNHARFLEKRIQSILDQTYQDFELIYLDDASTDNSNEIFSKFANHPKIRAIYNETNSGSPFKQWNKGVKASTGEYIWLAESDDYADKRFLEAMVDRLERHPSVGLAYCRSWIIDESGTIIYSCRDWVTHSDRKRWDKDFINAGKDECRNHLFYENTILNASSVLIRRKVYEDVGFANETLRLCGDWELWVKILLNSDIAFVSETLNYFRHHFKTVRRQSDLNGLSVEEYYQIRSFILKNLDCSPALIEEVCKSTFEKWKGILRSRDNKISWDRNFRIYKLANSIDPELNHRFIREISLYLLRRIHVPALGNGS